MKAQPTQMTAQEANDAMNELALTGESAITMQEAFKIIEGADKSSLKDVSRQYFKFEEKGEYIFLFTGFSKFSKDGQEVEVVELTDKDGNDYVNGDVMLVGACKRLTQVPAFMYIKYVEDIRSPKGSYKKLIVKTFESNLK